MTVESTLRLSAAPVAMTSDVDVEVDVGLAVPASADVSALEAVAPTGWLGPETGWGPHAENSKAAMAATVAHAMRFIKGFAP